MWRCFLLPSGSIAFTTLARSICFLDRSPLKFSNLELQPWQHICFRSFTRHQGKLCLRLVRWRGVTRFVQVVTILRLWRSLGWNHLNSMPPRPLTPFSEDAPVDIQCPWNLQFLLLKFQVLRCTPSKRQKFAHLILHRKLCVKLLSNYVEKYWQREGHFQHLLLSKIF